MRASCPSCGGGVDVKSRHVAVSDGAVLIYCSDACLGARNAPPVLVAPAIEPRRRRIWWIASGLLAGTTGLALAYGHRAAAPQNDPAP